MKEIVEEMGKSQVPRGETNTEGETAGRGMQKKHMRGRMVFVRGYVSLRTGSLL